ncbi:MAG: tetratricopeptide repeat protein, partial [Phycisphaeraceae bacterium]
MGCVLSANLAYADTVRDLVLRGNEYFARGEYERALRQYEAATAADANSFEAVYNTAVTLMRLDRHAEAERLFRTIDASPRGGHLASAARRGLGLSTLGRARERLQALMEQESTGSPAPPPIEGLEEVAGDYEDAAAWFRGALDFDPDDASAARGLEISRGELFALQRIIDQLKDMQSAQQEQESQGHQDQGEPDHSENGDGGQQQGDRDRSDSGGSGEDEPPEP